MAGVEVSNFPAFSLFPVKQKLSHYKKLDKKKKNWRNKFVYLNNFWKIKILFLNFLSFLHFLSFEYFYRDKIFHLNPPPPQTLRKSLCVLNVEISLQNNFPWSVKRGEVDNNQKLEITEYMKVMLSICWKRKLLLLAPSKKKKKRNVSTK